MKARTNSCFRFRHIYENVQSEHFPELIKATQSIVNTSHFVMGLCLGNTREFNMNEVMHRDMKELNGIIADQSKTYMIVRTLVECRKMKRVIRSAAV
ncbi:hypothetical protein BLOT_003227 [Blomia tropicalis]|nr:hypothetical protein BLOT_003227 [Blomia tropicalis]